MPWPKLVAAAVIGTLAGATLGGWLAGGTAFPSGVNLLVFYGAMLFGVPALAALGVARPGYNVGTGAAAGAAGVIVTTLGMMAIIQPGTGDMGNGAYLLLAIWLPVSALVGAAIGAMACGIAGARMQPER